MAGRPRRDRPCAFIDAHTLDGPISLGDVAKALQAAEFPGDEYARVA